MARSRTCSWSVRCSTPHVAEPQRHYRVDGPVHRMVPSRFPPVGLFDTARDEDELRMLAELEGLTNDRLRQQIGQLSLVPAADAIYGPGCTPIMAAFCHPATSRFTDGSYGVYYAALRPETAIAETKFHRERFLAQAAIPVEVLEMRCYTTTLAEPMSLLPDDAAVTRALLDPDSYQASQPYGAAARAAACWGLFYPSVRDAPDGRCVAVFRPRALRPVMQATHYRYFWNGQRIHQIESYTRMDVR